MMIADLFEETYAAIMSNKARSGLTMLGIVIGIASVIAMVSVGQGAQSSIESSIQSIGSNLIMVMPGFPRSVGGGASAGRGGAQTLTIADAEAIKGEITGVKAVAPEASRRYQVMAKGNNTNTSVVGSNTAYPEVRNIAVESGNFFSEEQYKSAAKVAVLGPTTATDIFGEDVDPVGQTIKIKQVDFKVIGVNKAKGGSGFGSQDDMIIVPISAAQRYLSGGDTYLSSISVQAESESGLTELQTNISELLLKRHKISDATQADFQIMNQADIVATASSVTGTFTMLLGAIAGISLLVGGIGIMNMMLTSVTERTREIGLRKAIGAKSNEISQQFLFESVALTFFGGLTGIVVGYLIAMAISRFASIATTISSSSVLLAFGVSAGIGIIFGYYPAKRASRMNPIEALRYE